MQGQEKKAAYKKAQVLERRANHTNGPGSSVSLALTHLREIEASMVSYKAEPHLLAAIRKSIKEAEATESRAPADGAPND